MDLWVVVHGLVVLFISMTVVDVSNSSMVIIVCNSPRVHVRVFTGEVSILVADDVSILLVDVVSILVVDVVSLFGVDDVSLLVVGVMRLLNVSGGSLMMVRLNVVVVLGAVGVSTVSVMMVLGVGVNVLIKVNVAVLLGMEGKRLVGHIMVLNSVLGLRLDLVEKLIVLVLNVVHQSRAMMVVSVVTVDITGVVVVRV